MPSSLAVSVRRIVLAKRETRVQRHGAWAGGAIPFLGFAAFSGVGKTHLIERLLPLLRARGLRVGLIKHAHHQVDVDQPGKDSFRHRQAGANPVMLASDKRWALMMERDKIARSELSLEELRAVFEAQFNAPGQRESSGGPGLDLVLVEGFRHEAFAKIELHRPSLGHPLLALKDPHIVAVASDEALFDIPPEVPQLDLNDAQQVADFILGLL